MSSSSTPTRPSSPARSSRRSSTGITPAGFGGLKEVRYDRLMAENPEKAMMLAIKGMIPDTTIGRKALTRVRIYKGAQHNHQAQNPTAWTL